MGRLKKQPETPPPERIAVQGEYKVIKEGTESYVIMQLVCKTEEEAQKLLEARRGQYKNLKIVRIV